MKVVLLSAVSLSCGQRNKDFSPTYRLQQTYVVFIQFLRQAEHISRPSRGFYIKTGRLTKSKFEYFLQKQNKKL